MSTDHVREELGAYVLDALEPWEREAVGAHLASCAKCAAEHERLAVLPPLLARAHGLEIPAAPAAVEERLLDRVAAEHRGRRQRRRRRLAALGRGRRRTLAVGALAGAVLGVVLTLLAARGDDTPVPAGQYSRVLNGAGGAWARADLRPGRDGTEVHLSVRGLPPGDAVYEVRCERPGWSATAGTFRVDGRGRAYVVLTTAARPGELEWIRVVRRSKSGDSPVLSGKV
jgi:Putative zinc-finger